MSSCSTPLGIRANTTRGDSARLRRVRVLNASRHQGEHDHLVQALVDVRLGVLNASRHQGEHDNPNQTRTLRVRCAQRLSASGRTRPASRRPRLTAALACAQRLSASGRTRRRPTSGRERSGGAVLNASRHQGEHDARAPAADPGARGRVLNASRHQGEHDTENGAWWSSESISSAQRLSASGRTRPRVGSGCEVGRVLCSTPLGIRANTTALRSGRAPPLRRHVLNASRHQGEHDMAHQCASFQARNCAQRLSASGRTRPSSI